MFENDDERPDMVTKSLFLRLWLLTGVILKLSLSSLDITASSYFKVSDFILEINSPLIDDTFAIRPSPPVPVLLKFRTSPIFWLLPLWRICNSLTEPDSTVWISIFWVVISFASVIKSFPAVLSDTL